MFTRTFKLVLGGVVAASAVLGLGVGEVSLQSQIKHLEKKNAVIISATPEPTVEVPSNVPVSTIAAVKKVPTPTHVPSATPSVAEKK